MRTLFLSAAILACAALGSAGVAQARPITFSMVPALNANSMFVPYTGLVVRRDKAPITQVERQQIAYLSASCKKQVGTQVPSKLDRRGRRPMETCFQMQLQTAQRSAKALHGIYIASVLPA